MILSTVEIVLNVVHVTGLTQLGVILKQEIVIVILDGKVVIAMKVG